MKVNISVDTQDVEAELLEYSNTVTVGTFTGEVRGPLEDIVSAVVSNIQFSFDREDAELGEVIQLPVVNR